MQGCPADRNIVTSNLTSTQIWTKPNITDPHGKPVTITTNYQKSEFTFPWGEFTVQYSAVKPANGLRVECLFKISVKRKYIFYKFKFIFIKYVTYEHPIWLSKSFGTLKDKKRTFRVILKILHILSFTFNLRYMKFKLNI